MLRSVTREEATEFGPHTMHALLHVLENERCRPIHQSIQFVDDFFKELRIKFIVIFNHNVGKRDDCRYRLRKPGNRFVVFLLDFD